MTRVVFSQAARWDRQAITAYTVERFGLEQARRLRERFETTIHSLAEAPLIGHRRQDLDPPGRSFRYATVLKTFIIVYEPVDDGIRIVRLLHGARNLAEGIARDPGDEGQDD
jgi:toxin ParE1/3/4